MKNKKYQVVLIGILLVGCSKSSPYYPPASGTASPTPAQTTPTPTPTPTPAPTPTTPTPAVAHGWTSVATLDSSVIARAPSSFLCFEKQSGDRDVHFYGGVDGGIQMPPYPSIKWARYILGTSNPGVTPPTEFGNLRINRNRALMMCVDSQAYALGGDSHLSIPGGVLPIMHFAENPTGTGYWEDVTIDKEQGYYFELNNKMMRWLPIVIGNYRTPARPIPSLEEYNPTTKAWDLITDQGLNSIEMIPWYCMVDEKFVILNSSEVTMVDLSNLPNTTITQNSLIGMWGTPGITLHGPIIWAGNGKIFVFPNAKGYPVSGVHEYDLAANTLTRRQDLDPPFELWSAILTSNKGRPQASGASYVFLTKEFNPSRTTPHTYAFDDRHIVYEFRP